MFYPCQPFGTHPEGFLGLHVGLCWLLLGSCWLQVAPSWLQGGSRYVYVGSSWPQDAQERPQRPPKYPKMRPKWLQDGFQIDMFWLQGVFFEICFRTSVFPRFFTFRELGKHQFSQILEAKSDEFCIILGILGRVCSKKLKIAAGWHT